MSRFRLTQQVHHLVIALVAGALYLAGSLEFLENGLMDIRFRLAGRPAESEVLVVAIDPKSLEALEVWPWPRGYHATVLETLLEAGARKVAFDLDFSSRSVPGEDRAFQEALAAFPGRAILPVFRQWQSPDASEGRLRTTRPLPALAEHAVLATINIRPERGGLVRRYWHGDLESGGYPSMAMALGEGHAVGSGSFYLDYGIDPATIPRISYVDVLTGQFQAAQVDGRAVIVGATAVELGDTVAVPVHTAIAGPVLQALAFETLASGRALFRWPSALALALTLALGLALGPRLEQSSWRQGLGLVLLASSSLFLLSVFLQTAAGLILDTSPLFLAFSGSFSWGLVRRIDQQRLGLLLQAVRVRSSETMMHHLVENSSEAIITADAGGRIETFNPAAERMFGYARRDVMGKPVAEMVEGALGGPGTSDGGARRQATGSRRDGSTFDLELSCTEFPFEGHTRRVLFLIDITRRKEQEQALEHQATHDALTGLPNRVKLQRKVEEVLGAAGRERCPVAFLILDLDRFKDVNDTLGHHIGDLLLRKIALRLKGSLREDDTIARLGGDEFAILLPETDREEARAFADRVIEELRKPFEVQGLTLQVDTSIGVAMYPQHGREATLLIQRADVAMYVAKKVRNTVAIYDPVDDYNSVRHLTLKGELRRALEDESLVLHYQPKICTVSGRVDGVEALIRWEHPRHGLVMPEEFIPLAEHTGMIKPITQWVLDDALRQCAAWRGMGMRLPVSVNCSARNLLEEDLPELIRGKLQDWGLPPDHLILEITETAIIEDPDRALEVVTLLADQGVWISIDDFGMGYSSLSYLRKLPARELKIDRSFVMGMDQDEGSAVIVRSTVELAHNLGLQAVAEGVDSMEVWNRLRTLGCDRAQGYLFSRPLAAGGLTHWIRTSSWGVHPDAVSLAGAGV